MSTKQIYAQEIHGKLGGFLATWLPNMPVAVGDVGTVDDGVFTKIGTLKDFGIAFEAAPPGPEVNLDYASEGAVEITSGAAGDAPIPGTVPANVSADIAVSFKRANAVLFQAAKCRTITTANLMQVSDRIIALSEAGEWPKNQVVVTDVVRCAALTVLISSSENAHITLRAKGDLGTAQLKLASLDVNFEVKSSSSIGVKIVSEHDLTPLFTARGVKTPFFPWNDPTLVVRKGEKLILDPLGPHQLFEVGPDVDRGG